MALLAVEGVTKRFGELRAVDGVSLSFEEGTVTSIIGPNGAGKTTLVNLISGLLPLDGGRVWFRGRGVSGLSPQDRVKAGIARSFQTTSVFPELSVRENLTIPLLARLGRSGRLLARLWEDGELRDELAQLLEQMGLSDVASTPAAILPYGKRRLLEIALAMASYPTLMVLDEPTAGLTAWERRELLELLRKLVRQHRKTLILVEHDMDMVFAVSDRIVVMHRGRVLADGTPAQIRQDPAVREVYLGSEDLGLGPQEAGRAPSAGRPSAGADGHVDSKENPSKDGRYLARHDPAGHGPAHHAPEGGDALLRAENLHTYYGSLRVIQGVNLVLRPGECLCLLGRNGAGKSTLMKSLSGVLPPRQGRVWFRGNDVTGWPAHRVARAGLAYVPDDRRIFTDLTVAENLQLGELALGGRRRTWTRERLVELFPNLREMLGRPAGRMSGGEQKMLAIARGLMGSPSLLLLDEPSEGLAPKVVQAMAEALRAIRSEGVSLLVADQNVRFARLVGQRDRAYILEKGVVQGEGPLGELLENQEVVTRYLAV